jgi:fluoride exporter
MILLAVSAAAGAGAVLRYGVDRAVARRMPAEWPLGTLLINVTGSLLFGLLVGLSIHHGLGTTTLDVAGAGFCGGFTTLSTWAWESIALAETSEWLGSLLNVVGSVVAGLLAAAAGLGLARL